MGIRDELARLADLIESSRVVSDLPAVTTPAAVPSKDELCHQHFVNHPLDRKRTGRDLQDNVQPQGVRISYVTWNKVKKDN